MSWIFEIRDKSRRLIHLSDERWSHILEHSEMTNQIEQIKETLTNPDVITLFERDKFIRFYYKYFKERKEYLFISVKYLNGKGFVITSFYTDKIK